MQALTKSIILGKNYIIRTKYVLRQKIKDNKFIGIIRLNIFNNKKLILMKLKIL